MHLRDALQAGSEGGPEGVPQGRVPCHGPDGFHLLPPQDGKKDAKGSRRGDLPQALPVAHGGFVPGALPAVDERDRSGEVAPGPLLLGGEGPEGVDAAAEVGSVGLGPYPHPLGHLGHLRRLQEDGCGVGGLGNVDLGRKGEFAGGRVQRLLQLQPGHLGVRREGVRPPQLQLQLQLQLQQQRQGGGGGGREGGGILWLVG